MAQGNAEMSISGY